MQIKSVLNNKGIARFVQIAEVNSKKLMRRYVYFPELLYKNDTIWVPPLWTEERKVYTQKNPVLSHSDYRLYVALQGKMVKGRILAYVDNNFNTYFNSAVGFFGAFECVDNLIIAKALFARAEEWLKLQGMSSVRGPINPVSECWGFLYKGFESPPVFLTPYNPPYYNTLMDVFGYKKAMDLLAYEGDAKRGYRIPDRFIHFRKKLLERKPEFRIRKLDFTQLECEAEHMWRISNLSLQGNWGYVPLDRGELVALFKKLKSVADKDAVLFVEDSGMPVGYCLGFPDLNIVLRQIKGRLFPFGFIKLFTILKKVTDFRLWALAVLPAYKNLGLDVLLYLSLYELLSPRKVRLEANWVLENNAKMRNALDKLRFTQTKVYRIYEKELV